jgi:hypothetical protein
VKSLLESLRRRKARGGPCLGLGLYDYWCAPMAAAILHAHLHVLLRYELPYIHVNAPHTQFSQTFDGDPVAWSKAATAVDTDWSSQRAIMHVAGVIVFKLYDSYMCSLSNHHTLL